MKAQELSGYSRLMPYWLWFSPVKAGLLAAQPLWL